MAKSKKLHNQISKKLDQLQELLKSIDEARQIDSDDPDTWDSDTLHDLVENLKEILKLLEDQEIPNVKDQFGDPVVSEEGLCSLVDSYQEENEEDDF